MQWCWTCLLFAFFFLLFDIFLSTTHRPVMFTLTCLHAWFEHNQKILYYTLLSSICLKWWNINFSEHIFLTCVHDLSTNTNLYCNITLFCLLLLCLLHHFRMLKKQQSLNLGGLKTCCVSSEWQVLQLKWGYWSGHTSLLLVWWNFVTTKTEAIDLCNDVLLVDTTQPEALNNQDMMFYY
jgi:hypothetical protein